MTTFTNNTPGARGINLKSGSVLLVEPGASMDVDDKDVEAFHPDLVEGGEKHEVPDAELIKVAVDGLDHANDEHWTKGGLPSVEAVIAALGADVTRAEIEAAAPAAVRVKPA